MTRRERFERDLRAMLKREGVEPMPPDSEIKEVVDFFDRHGANALPMMRAAMDEMVRVHRALKGHGENRSRPPVVSDE
jgi:Holliday junction resolvase